LYWILALSDRESPRFEIYHYRCMVVSQAGRPFFSPDNRKLLQQADGFHQVPLSLVIELPLVFHNMVTTMMMVFGSLTVRFAGPPWVKVIWAPSFVNKSLPSRGIGHSGKYRNS
jgi:hypothetical protein